MQRKVYQEVKDRYPYIVSNIDLTQDPSSDPTRACSIAGFQLFGTCRVVHCTNVTNEFVCLHQNCQPALRQLSPACLGCLFFGGRGQQCLADSASLYGDTFGLLLLSKKRLTDVKVVPLLQVATRLRGYIQAGVSPIEDYPASYSTIDPVGKYYQCLFTNDI